MSYTIKAERREQKKRPRMKQHGRGLKRLSIRTIARIHKVTKGVRHRQTRVKGEAVPGRNGAKRHA